MQSAGKVSATLTSAFVRAAVLGLLIGAVTTLTTRQQTVDGRPLGWESCLIAGAIVALSTVIARGGLEGGLDAGRQAEGNVSPADVQSNIPTLPAVVDPIGTPGATVQRVAGR